MTRIAPCIVLLALLAAPTPAASQSLLNEPESVVYDTLRACYLVSNWGDGRIVRISQAGEQSYVDSSQNNVAGIHILDDVLYCASRNIGVVGFDLETDEMVFGPVLTGNRPLQDITSDTSGFLYVTDGLDGKIYRVNPTTQACELLVATGIDGAGGIMFDAYENRLLVVFNTLGTNDPIYAISLPDGDTTFLVHSNVTAVDGLTQDNDGNIYLNSFTAGTVYKTDRDLTQPFQLWSSGHAGGADIEYLRTRCEVAIPEFNTDQLVCLLDPLADPDGDEVLHASDNCPWTSNPGQEDTDTDGVGDTCDNCPETSNPSQADLNYSGIGDACEPGFTRPGAWVSVDLTDSVRIIFGEVTEAGVTDVTLGASGPAAPTGYRPVSAAGLPYYDIHTDATCSGSILIRFLYNPAGITGAEEDLLLFHEIADAGWEDCTYSQDVASHLIWAEATSLSNFIIAEPGCPCDCHADPQCDGETNVLDVVKAVNVSFRGEAADFDPGCANELTDVSCDGYTNVIDVVKFVNVAFRSGDPEIEFCDPCAH